MADEGGQQQARSSEPSGFRRFCHLEIFRTFIGFLKTVEFIIILIGLIIVSSVSATGDVGAIKFYITMATIWFVCTMVHIVLLVIGLYDKLPRFLRMELVHIFYCGIGAVMFLLCSSVLLGKHNDDNSLVGGGIFGFIACGLLTFETLWFFLKYRREGSMSRDQKSKSDPPAKSGGDEFADPSQPGY